MKKIILFILYFLLGFGCDWIIRFIGAKFLSNVSFIFLPFSFVLPFIVTILIVCYLIRKDKGCIPIVGVVLGFVVSILSFLLSF